MIKLSNVFLALAMFGAVACGGGDTDKVKALADKMCACTDKACLDGAEAEGEALGKSMKDKYKKKEDVPKEVFTEMERGEKCATALEVKLAASAKPPAPAPAPAPTPAPAAP